MRILPVCSKVITLRDSDSENSC